MKPKNEERDNKVAGYAFGLLILILAFVIVTQSY